MDSTPGLALSTQGPGCPQRGPTPPPVPVPSTPVLAPPPGRPGLWSTLCLHLGGSQTPHFGTLHLSWGVFLRKPHASSQPGEPPPPRRPRMVSLLGPRCPLLSSGPPLLGCALLLAQVSSGTPGLGTPAFSRRSPDASLAAQPSSSGVLRIPHLAGPLVSPCPGPVLRFLRVVSPRPRAVFYLFLFDIFPLGVCGGMFLLVTCKELL